MRRGRSLSGGLLALSISALAFTIAACSQQPEQKQAEPSAAETAKAAVDAAANSASAAPPADNTDTLSGAKLASFTGVAAKGETAFVTCKTCHAVEAGVNKIGPSLHAIVGREAGKVAGYTYSPANKNSGITWTREKLFQYLESPQRVVPGTKMAFAGFTDPQKRADVIAYLQTLS